VLRSEALFRSLFEDHAAVKLVIDPEDGRIVDANDAAARFYGWPRPRLKEMRIQDVNTATPDEVVATMEKVRRLQRTELALRHRLADGTIRDVAVYASRIQIGGRNLLHSVVHDVTDQRRAEEALRQAQRTLLMITLCNDAIIRAARPERRGSGSASCWVKYGGRLATDLRRQTSPVQDPNTEVRRPRSEVRLTPPVTIASEDSRLT
jgi:PAS domain S-box-containing protein